MRCSLASTGRPGCIRRPLVCRLEAALLLFLAPLSAADFRNATIVVSDPASKPQHKAAQMLAEEIEKRTQVRLRIGSERAAGQPAFVLSRASGPAEGFRLTSSADTATVVGNDDPGVIFGVGYLLRQLTMRRQALELPAGLDVTTQPKIAIRGHQLGYRPKTNAYDAWSVPMWEQYIRELAIFGTNTIELIPPRSDDAEDSPHFPLPKMEMMVEMSRTAA